MDKQDLLDLINDDDVGLLEVVKKASPTSQNERLISSFLEINDFYNDHKYEPKIGGNIYEHKLASRLNHIRANNELKDLLMEYDKYNLLLTSVKDFETVSDILEDDDMDLLSIEDNSVLHIKNVPNIPQKKTAEFIATRKPCKDFENYRDLFLECQLNLKNGNYKLASLEKHAQIQANTFFVLSGMLGYVQKMDNLEINDQSKINGRLRVIFDNGTESNLLLQSLIRSLQKEGGKLVIANNESHMVTVDSDDVETGYIYILKSLSTDPRISTKRDLFKIGFTTTNVENRIKNAEQDPTYLMAPVSTITVFKCLNMSPHRFERLLHRFLGNSRLDIEITDAAGNRYTPSEWFIAPLLVIEKTIQLIISGEIINYRYDKENKKIVKIHGL